MRVTIGLCIKSGKQCNIAFLNDECLLIASFPKKSFPSLIVRQKESLENCIQAPREDCLGSVLLDLGLELAGIGTNDLGHLFSIDKDLEGGHGTDFTGLSNVRDFVDIDLFF
jgi:hypothetical protein